MTDETPTPARPDLRILTPDATPEEVAAVVAVLAALGGSATRPAPRPRPEWAANHYKQRVTYRQGRGAWRSSGLPH